MAPPTAQQGSRRRDNLSRADAAERRNARAVEMALQCWYWLDEDVIAIALALRTRDVAELEYQLLRACHSAALLQMFPADITGDGSTVEGLSLVCRNLARRVVELEKAL
jgi:hypothetical protein